ncbi:MAG: DUF2236 domain-containing protein [Saprospiraceae bacterium]|nr:DUF2236 domain-containing protein [Saprospiraceae bacterium]
MQTSKFVLNVLSKDGLVNHGVGLRSAVKVRTLHAFIRFFWKAKLGCRKIGAPINQEDYAGTMLSFSVFVVEGLESLGIKVSKEEKSGLFSCMAGCRAPRRYRREPDGQRLRGRRSIGPCDPQSAKRRLAIRKRAHPGLP